jgi:hypothetical protein
MRVEYVAGAVAIRSVPFAIEVSALDEKSGRSSEPTIARVE